MLFQDVEGLFRHFRASCFPVLGELGNDGKGQSDIGVAVSKKWILVPPGFEPGISCTMAASVMVSEQSIFVPPGFTPVISGSMGRCLDHLTTEPEQMADCHGLTVRTVPVHSSLPASTIPTHNRWHLRICLGLVLGLSCH